MMSCGFVVVVVQLLLYYFLHGELPSMDSCLHVVNPVFSQLSSHTTMLEDNQSILESFLIGY